MAKVIKVKDSYFNYLLSLISSDEIDARQDYYNLCTLLFDTEYTVLNPMDNNRANDASTLRERWLDNIRVKDERLKQEYANDVVVTPISVLEVLIALCVKVEDQILANPDVDYIAAKLFWELMDNLVKYGTFGTAYKKASDILTDEKWCTFTEDAMKASIKKVVTRTYHEDGRGGLFPIDKCKTNQRKMHLWANCMYYISTYH